MGKRLPAWLLSSDPNIDPEQIEKDLATAYESVVLGKLNDTTEGAKLRERLTNEFEQMLMRVGISDKKFGDAYEAFNEEVLPVVIDKDTAGIDLARLKANAKLSALNAVSAWDIRRDAYIIWALTNARETGWWNKLGGQNEFEYFEEFSGNILHEFEERNAKGSSVYDWKWITGTLIPLLQTHGGMSAKKAVAAVALRGKLRAAVPRMRHISDQYPEDPEYAAKMIVEIIEQEVLNPKVSADDIRAQSPGYRGVPNLPEPRRLSAENTKIVLTGPNQGYIMTRFEDKVQQKAGQMALKQVLDKPDAAFSTRDIASLYNEVKTTIKEGAAILRREPLREEEVVRMVQGDSLSLMVPVTLAELFASGREAVTSKINALVGEEFQADVAAYELIGFAGNELHIKFDLTIQRRLSTWAIYTRTKPTKHWSLRSTLPGAEDVAHDEGKRILQALVEENAPAAQVGIRRIGPGEPDRTLSPDAPLDLIESPTVGYAETD